MSKNMTTISKVGQAYVWSVQQAKAHGWVLRDSAVSRGCCGEVLNYRTAQGHVSLCISCGRVLA